MARVLLLVLAILPGVLSASESTNKLFQNTIKRWNIDISSNSDRSERWKRFVKAKETVDRTTRGAALDSLNLFTVLNDKEYEMKVEPLRRRLKRGTADNSTSLMDTFMSDYEETYRQKRGYTDVDIPSSYNYWEAEVGLNTPLDQYGCGSCWSFPTVATIEALYKEQTGETVAFSQQYFIDCTFQGDGCGGGSINDGYKVTVMRQFLLAKEYWPYTAFYQECEFAEDIASFNNNALKKLWVTGWGALSQNENGMLSGLLHSPVAFGAYVSMDIFDYSGGPWTDSSCSSDPNAHAMLLVGYTATTLRVQNSYGSDWGDGGYADYERGTATLSSCNFYKSAYYLTTTYRRELQYEWCNDKKLSTRAQCTESCEAMNTGTESGWTLAVIPTKYHNTLLVDMMNAQYAGVKGDDKFNYLWIGLTDIEKVGNYEWADGFTPVQYYNVTENIGKYGMINKNTGKWAFKNSLTYTARGMCSRAVNCWDIGTAVVNGQITFDDEELSEGTVATVTCSSGHFVEGASSLTCAGGVWSEDLPTCVPEQITVTAQETEVLCALKSKQCYLYCDITITSGEEVDTSLAKLCKVNDDGGLTSCWALSLKLGSYRRKMGVKKASGAGNFACVYYNDGGEVVAQSPTIGLTVE